MLKRVFPDRQHKTASRVNSHQNKSDGNQEEGEGSPRSSQRSVTSSSSPLRSTASASSSSATSSSTSSPVKSGGGGYQPEIGEEVSTTNLLSKSSKHNSRSCSSTEFQSLKLESMSTIEDFKSVSKTISSALDREILAKQSASGPSAGLGNDALQECTTSLSTPSDEEGDSSDSAAESLFRQQAKFFSQMKDYLLSQQSSLRQHLEVLNATVALRKKKITSSSTSSRRHHGHHQQQHQHQHHHQQHQRLSHSHHNASSGHSVHSHSSKQKADVTPSGGDTVRATQNNSHDLDLMNNEFHSCSSTEKSDDDIQVCPLCGVEIEDSENPAALEEHVASHWCSPDDPI